MKYDKSAINALEKRYRSTFMNSLTGYRSVHLCGTISNQGVNNLSVINSVVHLGAAPPLLGMVLRPEAAHQHTLQNIRDTRCFTLNQMSARYKSKVHQCAARYAIDEDEFEHVGLTPYFDQACVAPLVAESVVRYTLALEQILPVEANGTFFIVGSIQSVELDDTLVAPDGYVNLPAADILAVNGLDAYHTANPLGRMAYAKPHVAPKPLP